MAGDEAIKPEQQPKLKPPDLGKKLVSQLKELNKSAANVSGTQPSEEEEAPKLAALPKNDLLPPHKPDIVDIANSEFGDKTRSFRIEV